MQAAMVLVSVIATGFQMYSSYQEGQTEAAMAKYNQEVEMQKARQEENVALAESLRMREEKERYLATQRAGLSASGFTLEGSGWNTMEATANQFERSIALNTYNRELNAMNLRSTAGLYGMQASAARNKAIMSMIGAGLKGVPGILSAGENLGTPSSADLSGMDNFTTPESVINYPMNF